MNAIANLPLLLAQSDRWREMGRDFRVDHTKLDPGLIFVSLVVLAAVMCFLVWLNRMMNRQEGRRLYNNPKQLFRSLCRAHDLSRGQQRLLLQIARLQNLQQPAVLFVEPERFDQAAKAWTSQAAATNAAELKQILFAGLAQPQAENQESLEAKG
jgi:hypothetical protein